MRASSKKLNRMGRKGVNSQGVGRAYEKTGKEIVLEKESLGRVL